METKNSLLVHILDFWYLDIDFLMDEYNDVDIDILTTEKSM